jgi:hypothetical protein
MNDLQAYVAGLICDLFKGTTLSGFICEVEQQGSTYQPQVRVIRMETGGGVMIRIDPLP